MAIMKNPILVATIASVVAAQTSTVVPVFFPGAEGQSFIGSVITSVSSNSASLLLCCRSVKLICDAAQDASQTTIAVACPTDVDSNDCGFDEPITVTVGPSTFHAEESFEGITAILECSLDGSSSALCAETFIGPAYLVDSDLDLTASDATTDTALITTATSTSLSGTDIVFIPVTLVSDLDAAAETGATATASTASETGSAATTGSTASNGASSTTGTAGTTQTTGGTTAGTATGAGSIPTTTAGGNRAGSANVGLIAFTAGLLGLVALVM